MSPSVLTDHACVITTGLHKVTGFFARVQTHQCIVNLGCVEKDRLYLLCEYYMMHFDYTFKYKK